MMVDRQSKSERIPTDQAIELAVEEFRPLVEKILSVGRKGTHDLLLSVDDFGRPTIRVRGPYVHASQYDPG